MITVHHLNESRSQRIVWLLEELQIPYEVKFYKRDPKTMLAPPELRAIHPLGKAPVVTDNGLVLAESGAIIETLIERHDKQHRLVPEQEADRVDYRFWLHFAEGSMMPNLLLKLVFSKLVTQSPFFIRPLMAAVSGKIHSLLITPNFEGNFALVESQLAKSKWFAGETFSAADIQMSFPLEAVHERFGYSSGPNMLRYLEAIRKRPAYQKAVERVGQCFE
jgi:glutathione S-transferase